MKNAGRLDTLITIEQRSGVQEPVLGTFSYSWTVLAQVWAEVRDLLPGREQVSDGVALARRPVRLRIRHRDDVTSAMRVVLHGETYRITGGPARIGRREALELVCELLTTEGAEP